MYQMAAYCRLSKDDGENKISESIENQMKLIREYVSKSEDLEIADIYIDDGYSGLYFANRPEFQRMMEDIYKGKIQGVITKDISRKIFPVWGVNISKPVIILNVFFHLSESDTLRFWMVWIRSHTAMKNWHSLRHYLMICTAVIFPRRSEAHFPHRKSEGSLCLVLHLTGILKIRRINITFL